MTPEIIKQHIANVKNLTDEELTHHQKCCTSNANSTKLKPYLKAIEAERKARGKKPLKD